MNALLMKVGVGAVALILGGAAIAQSTPEVQVIASRGVTTKPAGRSSSGIPILDVSLSYGVSIADLDLATNAGALQAERRVQSAAKKACTELGRQFPVSGTSNADCTKEAADKAMLKVHDLVAAAKASANR